MPHIFTVTITDAELAALNDSVIDADQWVADAVAGKINQSTKRAVQAANVSAKSGDLGSTVPSDETALLAAYFALDSYETRAEKGAA